MLSLVPSERKPLAEMSKEQIFQPTIDDTIAEEVDSIYPQELCEHRRAENSANPTSHCHRPDIATTVANCDVRMAGAQISSSTRLEDILDVSGRHRISQ